MLLSCIFCHPNIKLEILSYVNNAIFLRKLWDQKAHFGSLQWHHQWPLFEQRLPGVSPQTSQWIGIFRDSWSKLSFLQHKMWWSRFLLSNQLVFPKQSMTWLDSPRRFWILIKLGFDSKNEYFGYMVSSCKWFLFNMQMTLDFLNWEIALLELKKKSLLHIWSRVLAIQEKKENCSLGEGA